MKKIRRRLGLIFILLILFSSLASVTMMLMVRNDIIFSKNDFRILIFGYALKDLFLFIVALFIVIMLVAALVKRTASPIVDLSKAAREITAGNFDIEVEESGRKDELGELAKQFNIMIRELRSNEYLKKDFISNVSHEFKTPLAIINGYGMLLTEDNISSEERKEYAGLIVRESNRLSKLTSNILRLSKLSNDKIHLNRRSFSLDEQIRQIILLLEPKWSKKHLRFQLHLPHTIYMGDEELLSEIWLNLLDNAVKYSPETGLIDISLIETQYTYQIYLRDQGPGIDKDTINHIFEQFYQGDTSHKNEGAGLGLSIAQKIAELHGGTISCSSKPGQGCTFTVSLKKYTL